MDNTYTPLVAFVDGHEEGEHLRELHRDQIKALIERRAGEQVAWELGYDTAVLSSRKQTHAELAELRAENERMRGALDTMVSTLERVGRSTDQSASFRIGEALNIGYNAQAWEATRKTDQQLYAEAEQNIPQESFDRIEKGILAVDRLDELKTAIDGLPRFTECSNGQFVLRTDVLELLADQPSTKDTE